MFSIFPPLILSISSISLSLTITSPSVLTCLSNCFLGRLFLFGLVRAFNCVPRTARAAITRVKLIESLVTFVICDAGLRVLNGLFELCLPRLEWCDTLSIEFIIPIACGDICDVIVCDA